MSLDFRILRKRHDVAQLILYHNQFGTEQLHPVNPSIFCDVVRLEQLRLTFHDKERAELSDVKQNDVVANRERHLIAVF